MMALISPLSKILPGAAFAAEWGDNLARQLISLARNVVQDTQNRETVNTYSRCCVE